MDAERRQSPPRAEQRPLAKTLHNVIRIDEFDWLRAADWQDVIREPHRLPRDIHAYLEAENSYTATAMRSGPSPSVKRVWPSILSILPLA